MTSRSPLRVHTFWGVLGIERFGHAVCHRPHLSSSCRALPPPSSATARDPASKPGPLGVFIQTLPTLIHSETAARTGQPESVTMLQMSPLPRAVSNHHVPASQWCPPPEIPTMCPLEALFPGLGWATTSRNLHFSLSGQGGCSASQPAAFTPPDWPLLQKTLSQW